MTGGKEGCNLATPVDLSMVPSLGTWAERQGTQAQSNGTSHLNKPITTPERTRLNEEEMEEGMTTSTEPENTETDHEQSGFKQTHLQKCLTLRK